MILNMSTKSLGLFFAIGAVTTTASNLRSHRRESGFFTHGGNKTPAGGDSGSEAMAKQLRSSSASDVSEDEPSSAAVTAEAPAAAVVDPSIALNKPVYDESESIVVDFSVGSPAHSYYSSSRLDYNYPQWSIGLFMRDADPQGGTLAPIVSVNVCGAMGTKCDADDRNYRSYNDLKVTFGNDYLDLMEGRWPLEVSDYGTGFDAYVLDGKGAAAIGPLEFNIRNEDNDGDYDMNPVYYRPSSKSEESVESSYSIMNSKLAGSPLIKYQKGTKKATERQHAAVSKPTGNYSNTKIIQASGLQVIPSQMESVSTDEEEEGPSKSSITANKEEYEDDESVTVEFTLPVPSEDNDIKEDLSNYKIGIFMRMAHPQKGALEPVVSLPLCSNEGSSKCDISDGMTKGSVTFSQESLMMMPEGGQWPIDLYQWGTGFDAYVLDDTGDDVVGPVKFNILMDGTS